MRRSSLAVLTLAALLVTPGWQLTLGDATPRAMGATAQDAEAARTSGPARKKGGGGKQFVGECFDRTELFFGSARPGGSAVTEAEFQQFLDREIAPRFPGGLTLLVGVGLFRDSAGDMLRERSMMLILLYPENTRRDNSERIEQVRRAYRQTFQQTSVLRADRRCERVGF